MDYSETKAIIEKGKILSVPDGKFISDNIKTIQENWKKRQKFRTETEMRISVLNDIKFPTPAAKYWQCVREQSVFYENLVQLSFEYRRNKIEQEKLKIQIEKEEDELERELLQIDLEEKQFGQVSMEQVAEDRVREIRLWSQLMNELTSQAKFNTEDVNEHQLLSYAHRFNRQMKNIGNASPSELSNLVGQYKTAIRHLEEKGMITSEQDPSRQLEDQISGKISQKEPTPLFNFQAKLSPDGSHVLVK